MTTGLIAFQSFPPCCYAWEDVQRLHCVRLVFAWNIKAVVWRLPVEEPFHFRLMHFWDTFTTHRTSPGGESLLNSIVALSLKYSCDFGQWKWVRRRRESVLSVIREITHRLLCGYMDYIKKKTLNIWNPIPYHYCTLVSHSLPSPAPTRLKARAQNWPTST